MVDLSCSTKIIIDSIKVYKRYQPNNQAAILLSELVDFATWAFDCTNFPNLEIIGMGEFHNFNPEKPDCVVLRRRADLPRYSQGRAEPLLQAFNEYKRIDSTPMIPFEFLNPQDSRTWEGLQVYREMFYTNSPQNPWDGNI